MPELLDRSGSVDSNFVAGNGTQTATFTLSRSLQLNVESVVAAINNASLSAVQPKVTIRDPAGNIVATVVQARSIPAGDTGNATWALRLADMGELTGIYYDIENTGGTLEVETTGPGSDSGIFGIILRALDSQGISLDATDTNGEIRMASGFFFFDVNGGIYRFTDASLFDIAADSFFWSGDDFTADAGSGFFFDLTSVGISLTVNDSNGQPIFRVDENGDLHGKTGKALTFDL